jgi:hypothetical protein
MKVLVHEVYRDWNNLIDSRDTITIWGDPGWLCRSSWFSKLEGKRLFIRMKKVNPVSLDGDSWPDDWAYVEQENDFEQFACAVNNLLIEGDLVKGGITKDIDKYPVSHFRALMRSNTASEYFYEDFDQLLKWSNPFGENSVKVYLPDWMDPSQAELYVIDSQGRLVGQTGDLLIGKNLVEISALRPGVYFVTLLYFERRETVRVVMY